MLVHSILVSFEYFDLNTVSISFKEDIHVYRTVGPGWVEEADCKASGVAPI